MEEPSMPKLKDQAKEIRMKRSAPPNPGVLSQSRQFKFSVTLLLFICLFGLPIIGISSLRQKLQHRVRLLAEAMFDDTYRGTPLEIAVGEGGPFPKEYEREIIPRLSSSDVVYMPEVVYQPVETGSQEIIDMTMTEIEESESEDEGPRYGQGEQERAAYELLFKSNAKVAALIEGGEEGLSFQTWAAAPMEDGTYWVKLTFNKAADGLDAQYIWKVDLTTQKIVPLNFNARGIRPDGSLEQSKEE
jgi:hypothetical protein